jgi:hypothetical protein
VVFFHATKPWQIEQARTLILEYTKALGIDLGFQDFEQEMADFPGTYSPPGGRLLLALNRVRGRGLCRDSQVGTGHMRG